MAPAGPSSAALLGAVAQLERSIAYTRTSLQLVTPELLTRPTPCLRWNLGALLVHMYDSLSAMQEAADVGRIELVPVGPPGIPIVNALQDKACALLGAWMHQDREQIGVSDAAAGAGLLAGAGALEITVHGWDVARACGVDRPIPEEFAAELLELAPSVASAADRPSRFGPRVVVAPAASVSDRLVAFLGRTP